MGLRPYQIKCLEAIQNNYRAGIEKQVAVLATGLGKTVVASHVPAWFPGKRTLFLVHTEELVQQAEDKMRHWNPGARVGVEMGQKYAGDHDDIIVASVQTLGREGGRRIQRFNPEQFGAVIVDECQHVIGSTYERTLEWFGLTGEKKAGRLLLGITATPGRSDGVGLARIFDKISFSYDLLQAIKDGWLCNLRGARIRTGTSLDSVHTSAGEFDQNELALAVNTESRNRLVADGWLKYGEGRKTLGFAVNIAHAIALAEAFKAAGIKAEAVWGVDADRAVKLAAHRAGEFQVLFNASMLIEGYDDPSIACILDCAPTKSQMRYAQRLGRGTRLPDGVGNLHEARANGLHIPKEDCLVLSVTDNCTRHNPVSLPTLFGLPSKLSLGGRSVVDAVEEFEQAKAVRPETDFSELEDLGQIDSFIQRVDLFEVRYAPEVEANSKLQWHRTASGDYLLLLPGNERISIAEDLLGQWKIQGRVQGNEFEDTERNLSDAFGTADNMLRYLGRNLMQFVRREKGGKAAKEPMTRTQENAIRFNLRMKNKAVPDLTGMTKFEASKLLRKLSIA